MRVSILILILIIIIVVIEVTIRCLWRRRGRLHKAIKTNLSSCSTTDMGVHLTQLITECVKASIHAPKLRHKHLKGYTTHRRRSGCGWSKRCWRSCCLGSWPLWSKLGLSPSNGRCVYGTHDGKMCRLKIGDRCMAENSRDS